MNLSDYEKRIDEIHDATGLTAGEKRAALEMTADEIEGCLWQPPLKSAAQDLASRARGEASRYPEGGLEALDGLAVKRLLKAKRSA